VNYQLRIFNQNSSEYWLSLILRYRTLRHPLGLNYTRTQLEAESKDIHLGLFDDNRIYASLILSPKNKDTIQLRQMAVDLDFQSKGIGRKLLIEAEQFAQEKGYSFIFCHARISATDFYEKLNYIKIGDEFQEVSIPHILMQKKL
jgi:predicted GNAT family N-acyltransferase